MKNLFDRLFRKQPEFSYTVAAYIPEKTNRLHRDIMLTEYQIEKPDESDEMVIDKIYQTS